MPLTKCFVRGRGQISEMERKARGWAAASSAGSAVPGGKRAGSQHRVQQLLAFAGACGRSRQPDGSRGTEWEPSREAFLFQPDWLWRHQRGSEQTL